MGLHFIGIGLSNEQDISLKGLELVKKADKIYLEHYTAVLNVPVENLERLYGKKIELANREFVEKENIMVEEAKTKEVAFLVVGDPFAATTHVDLFLRAKQAGVDVTVTNNASVLTAVGITGLQLYKFGKTTSIPFEVKSETPYNVLKDNQGLGLHTLFLLDLRPEEEKFMGVREAITYMKKLEQKIGEELFDDNTLCVGCARLGSPDQMIKAGTMKEFSQTDFGKGMQCLIIPGNLHFMEEEALALWK